MNGRSPFTRTAGFVCPALIKGKAQDQAKQMMGAGNPLTGKHNRAPASTFCPGCGVYHRSGTPCGGNAIKSLLMKATAVTTPGRKIVPTRSGTGNQNHEAATGRFTTHPEGSAERKSQTRFRDKANDKPSSSDTVLEKPRVPKLGSDTKVDTVTPLSSSDLMPGGESSGGGEGSGGRTPFQRPERSPRGPDHQQAAYDAAIAQGHSPHSARLAAGVPSHLLGPVPSPTTVGRAHPPESPASTPPPSGSPPSGTSPTPPTPPSSPTPAGGAHSSVAGSGPSPTTRSGATGRTSFMGAYGQGSAVGGGALSSPGGGTAPTVGLGVQAAHGLLNRPSQPTRVGSQVVPRQQQLQQQSSHINQQQQTHQQALQGWHPGTNQ